VNIQATIIITAIVLWFAQGYYLNARLRDVHKKLDSVLEEFNGLRKYLYEIDPQFDDERASDEAVSEGAFLSGMDDIELLKRKRAAGKRTLNTPLSGESLIEPPQSHPK
jgi:hypothetical protein